MPFYPKINLFFIHIPKTGGRNIENQLKKHSIQKLLGWKTSTIFPPKYRDCSPQHQTYKNIYQCREYFNIDFDKVKIFTFVRNPYNRCLSALKYKKLISRNTNQEKVYKALQKFINSTNMDNHNLQQYKFILDHNNNICEKIKIFKTEELNDINDKINKYIGVNVNYDKMESKDYMHLLNRHSINLINKVYKKDFDYFDYKLL